MENKESLLRGVLIRLLRYLRGCAVLIAVDAVVYTGLFWLIEVPYYPLFGVLSGMAVLFPGFGAVVAAAITLAVLLGCGVSRWQLLSVLGVYLIYGGVIEQFIVYPALVGGVLGLSKKESLLAILIGLVIGNLPGMLLALPVAGVVKYVFQRMRKGEPRC